MSNTEKRYGAPVTVACMIRPVSTDGRIIIAESAKGRLNQDTLVEGLRHAVKTAIRNKTGLDRFNFYYKPLNDGVTKGNTIDPKSFLKLLDRDDLVLQLVYGGYKKPRMQFVEKSKAAGKTDIATYNADDCF